MEGGGSLGSCVTIKSHQKAVDGWMSGWVDGMLFIWRSLRSISLTDANIPPNDQRQPADAATVVADIFQ